MGWLFKILTFPVSGPIDGVTWVAGKLLEQAEAELYSPEKIRGMLLELELKLELGEIGEAEYEQAEAELLARLREARERMQPREDA
jgi:hypothetical protein